MYKAGAKEGEPLAAIELTQENIYKYMVQPVEAAVQAGDVCSLAGGEC